MLVYWKGTSLAFVSICRTAGRSFHTLDFEDEKTPRLQQFSKIPKAFNIEILDTVFGTTIC